MCYKSEVYDLKAVLNHHELNDTNGNPLDTLVNMLNAVDNGMRKRLVYFAIFQIRIVCLNWSRTDDGKVVPPHWG